MSCRVLCVTDQSDRPETELFIGLKKSGVDIEVMSNPAGKHFHRLKNGGVTAYELALKSRFDPMGMRRIARQLDKKPYDILYCFNNPAVSNTLIASRGRPYRIITYRGIIGNIGLLSPASWTTHLHPRVSHIVCVCEAVREYMVKMKFLGMKVPPGKPITIYKGHRLEWYDGPAADPGEFGIPANAFVAGFAGRNRRRKGLHVIIDATRHLPAGAPIHFLLMGRLESDRRLRQRIRKSPFKDRIHLTGFRDDVPAISAACDAFIMPSTEREGLSRAVIEAMSRGTAPIVSDVGGLPELVVDRESGLVVPPRDPAALAGAIMALFENPAKRRRMGEAARQRIQNDFNIETTIDKTRKLFERLLLSPTHNR
jgi:glycosyltransferase involved in cell wall biosynthesis